MKKLFAVKVVAVLAAIMMSEADAATVTIDGNTWTYEVKNGEVTITDLTRSVSGDVEIPPYVNGCPVTGMSSYAFYRSGIIRNVVIGNFVKHIGPYSFYGCSTLKSVTIAGDVESIGSYSFKGCSTLKSVTITGDVKSIGPYSFYGCSTLKSVTITGDVKSIGSYSFYKCSAIENVTLPKNLNSIGAYVFYDCHSIKSVTIPQCVCNSTLRNHFPHSYQTITEVRLAPGVTDVGMDVFAGCSALVFDTTTVPGFKTVDGWVLAPAGSVSGHVDITGVHGIGRGAFRDCTAITGVTIADGVKYIGSEAFAGCASLADVSIPDSVTDFGGQIFSGCGSLIDEAGFIIIKNSLYGYYGQNTSVSIPEGVERVSFESFSRCTTLRRLTIPASVGQIDPHAFYDCGSLAEIVVDADNVMYKSVEGALLSKDGKSFVRAPFNAISVTIPEGVVEIRPYAFQGCRSLTDISIPEGVENIGEYAFSECVSLPRIRIPDSITNIGKRAFHECRMLRDWTVPQYVCGSNWFRSSGVDPHAVTNIVISDNAVSIGDDAFAMCRNLAGVRIGSGVTSIGSHAFYDCRRLREVNLPDSVRSIGEWAFMRCVSLEQLTFGNSVTNIAPYAFNQCRSLADITIPDSVPVLRTRSFNGCISLASIRFEGDAPRTEGFFQEVNSNCTAYVRRDSNGWDVTIPGKWRGINIDYQDDKSLYAPVADFEWTVVDGSVTITGYGGTAVFVVIPPVIEGMRVTGIAGEAFSYNEYAERIVIPGAVTNIGYGAFYACTRLAEVTIPPRVRAIGSVAFANCTSLSEVRFIGRRDLVDMDVESAFRNTPWLETAFDPPVNDEWGDAMAISGGDGSVSGTNYGATSDEDDTALGFGTATVWWKWTAPESGVVRFDTIGSGFDTILGVCVDEGGVLRRVAYNDDCEESTGNESGVEFEVQTGAEYLIGVSGWSVASGNILLNWHYLPEFEWVADDVTVTVTGYNGRDGVADVPAHIEDMPVVSIGAAAFAETPSLMNVAIPETVTNIADYAFYGCTSLTSVAMSPGVVRIGNHAFNGCTKLETAKIPEGVETIGDFAFRYSALTCVTLPGSVRSLGEGAFYGCDMLERIHISEGVTDIGVYAFSGCSSLQSYEVDGMNPAYKSVDGLLLSKDGRTLIACPGMAVSVAVPDGVTHIAERAFEGCVALERVTVPDSVMSIGAYAFYGCEYLAEVTGCRGITELSEGAFADCFRLESVLIPEGVDEIASYLFYQCVSLQHAVIPQSVSGIGEAAFYWCDSLTSITIPDRVSTIGDMAFEGCRSLRSVMVGRGVGTIGEYAFYDCASLDRMKFSGNAPTIGEGAFYYVNPVCVVQVKQDSSGWGTDIPGTWYGMSIAYLENRDLDFTVSVCGVPTNVTWGTELTFRVPDPLVDETCTTQVVYLGTSSILPPAAEFTVTVTNDISFAWDILVTNYWLDVSSTEGGSVDFTNGWIGAGSRMTLTAGPEFGHALIRWEGDVTESQSALPQISFVMDRAKSLSAVFGDAPLTLGEALNAPSLEWYTEGDAEWFGEWSRSAADGVHSARAGAIGDSQETVLGLRIEGSGTLSFDWRTSCETKYDAVRLEVDGSSVRVLSGETVWTNVCVELGPGEHNARWVYRKGRSGSGGEDTVWVDNVNWTPAEAPTFKEAVGDFEWETEGDVAWKAIRSSSAYEGGSFAITAGLGDYDVSVIRTRVSGSGRLMFRWAVSCEESYDWLDFLVDGEVVEMVTGETGWREVVVDLEEGAHELEWVYWKDEMDDPALVGANCAMLDYVRWYPEGEAPPEIGEETLDAFFGWLKQSNQIDAEATRDAAVSVFTLGTSAPGKKMSLYEEFVAGTDPEDAESVFKATIDISSGKPVVNASPDLGASRKYTVYGKKDISDASEMWTPVTAGEESAYRFFKVTVELP